jgi:hypothetical protein
VEVTDKGCSKFTGFESSMSTNFACNPGVLDLDGLAQESFLNAYNHVTAQKCDPLFHTLMGVTVEVVNQRLLQVDQVEVRDAPSSIPSDSPSMPTGSPSMGPTGHPLHCQHCVGLTCSHYC